jgi:exosortase
MGQKSTTRRPSSAKSGKDQPSTIASLQDSLRELRERPDQLYPLLALIGLVLALIWSYWNTLVYIAGFWDDPLYSHGWLVPIFTLALLWIRREPFVKPTLGASLCGLALLAAGLGLRLVATHYAFVTIIAFSLVPSLAGVFLLVGGWSLVRWAGPAILFLVFMFPLPTLIKENILGWLQLRASAASTYVLQTMGIMAYHEGNRISIGDLQLGVVDACAGLRMATIFFALAVAIVLVVDRPWWDRLIILLSAIPIALAVNVVRVTVTGILYMLAGDSELAHKVFHEWAGWFMMSLALGLLYVELQILSHLVIEDTSPAVVSVGPRRPRPAPHG